ncbi:response regulator transcription factor [Aureimonas frigidaquae]|uniref:Two-component response regulator n=1 Tax=Aureimonas frigidaquae TaxID=424757 RepID=A0A0P0Z3B9_9HYPH|nr:response regulator transcription factor [Aureimonas frigidaquae]BAT28560.1 two-component response regulator [Aureimonas frigidaquae]
MRILLIEDSTDIADAIMSKLEAQGFTVTLATDGEEGQELALAQGFDVIVLDVNLPRRNGFEVLRAMRDQRVEQPVIVITARNQIADKLDLLALGADDYLVKPFDLRELIARIRTVMRRHMGASRALVTHGPLALDLNARSATIGGQPLDLGKREFETLEILASRFGKVVGKEELVNRLFRHDDAGSPNAIELLISRLRRKLAGSGLEIATQRNAGYSLGSAPARPTG